MAYRSAGIEPGRKVTGSAAVCCTDPEVSCEKRKTNYDLNGSVDATLNGNLSTPVTAYSHSSQHFDWFFYVYYNASRMTAAARTTHG
ncbi:hypothetical protein KCP78_11230 [Salmonella enterica subsp. enterica]|nr:hypothetical protein KCP78_11230 [Salmonella enterica subsp. enterica]